MYTSFEYQMMEVNPDMAEYVGMFVIGILLVIIGISNTKGNISSLHSYHRKRVSEEDRIPFGKKVGLGTILCGGSMIVCGIFNVISVYLNNPVFLMIGEGILIVGIIVGLVIMFRAMMKYNKGIF